MDFVSREAMSKREKPGPSGQTPQQKRQEKEGSAEVMPEVPTFPAAVASQPTGAEIMLALQQMNASLTADLKQVKERLSVVDEVKVQVEGVRADVVSLTKRVTDLEMKKEGGVGSSASGVWGSRSEGPNVQRWREGHAPMMQTMPMNMSMGEEGEREREMREMERKQVYVNGFPYATDKKKIIDKMEHIVGQMRESGMEIQTKCNLVKSSFGILVFSSNVERESFLRKKWAGDDAMVEEKFEDKTLRYSRPSTKEDRHIGRCLAKAKRAMCELEMPASEIVICRRGKRVWWGSQQVARYDEKDKTMKYDKDIIKDAVDFEKLEATYRELMAKSE